MFRDHLHSTQCVGVIAMTGFALTGDFRYFTVLDQHILENKLVIGQTYWLIFCLTGSPKKIHTHTHTHTRKAAVRERVCACSRWERKQGI